MKNRDYYNYYEILFSLRKEYLKNQRIINKLLSYIRIINDPLNKYDSNLVFKANGRDDIDSLLLIVKKRQSCISLILDSLYSSLIYNDSYLKPGYFSYTFRLSEEYIYLLDDSQDGRHLSAKVEITNQKEFIELYRQLIENVICKRGSTYLISGKEIIRLSNNGIHLFYAEEDDYKKCVKLDYDGIGDSIITNNALYLENIMRLMISKNIIHDYFRNIIDSNMDDYSYIITGDCNKSEGFYKIEDHGKKLVLKPENDKEYILRQ